MPNAPSARSVHEPRPDAAGTVPPRPVPDLTAATAAQSDRRRRAPADRDLHAA